MSDGISDANREGKACRDIEQGLQLLERGLDEVYDLAFGVPANVLAEMRTTIERFRLRVLPAHQAEDAAALKRRVRELEAELATLRAVPTGAPDEAVCIDDDCPYPEHVNACPPATPKQWEHLARLRGKHLASCHERMKTARSERDEALRMAKAQSERAGEAESHRAEMSDQLAESVRECLVAENAMEKMARVIDTIGIALDSVTGIHDDIEHQIRDHEDTLPGAARLLARALTRISDATQLLVPEEAQLSAEASLIPGSHGSAPRADCKRENCPICETGKYAIADMSKYERFEDPHTGEWLYRQKASVDHCGHGAPCDSSCAGKPEPPCYCAETSTRNCPQHQNAEERCDKPPSGWVCSRKKHHDGPCAARLRDGAHPVDFVKGCPDCGQRDDLGEHDDAECEEQKRVNAAHTASTPTGLTGSEELEKTTVKQAGEIAGLRYALGDAHAAQLDQCRQYNLRVTELGALRVALEWYADWGNHSRSWSDWRGEYSGNWIDGDGGKRAKAALDIVSGGRRVAAVVAAARAVAASTQVFAGLVQAKGEDVQKLMAAVKALDEETK